MYRFQTFTNWTAAVTQLGHLFCCGLPALFSILSLLSSFGVIISMPSEMHHFHHLVHDYELPLIMFAGTITALGWMLHYFSWKIDCRTTGCVHEPCGPKKKRFSKILIFSTILFSINLIVFFFFHGCH
jgi:hypothetical protein